MRLLGIGWFLAWATLAGCSSAVEPSDGGEGRFAEAAAPFTCGDQTCDPTQACIESHGCLNVDPDGGDVSCPPGYYFLPDHSCVESGDPVHYCAGIRPGCMADNPCSCVVFPGVGGSCTTADGRRGLSAEGCH